MSSFVLFMFYNSPIIEVPEAPEVKAKPETSKKGIKNVFFKVF